MTLLEMTPYIMGEKYTRECKPPARCTGVMYNKVVQAAAASETFPQIINLVEDYRDFMHIEPDIARLFPLAEREEIFYCLKNKGYSNEVPAKLIYFIKKQFNEYGSVSLALKSLSQTTFKVFFQKNYMDGVTFRDVARTFADSDYEPFTEIRYRIKHSDYHEVYIEKTDMVALLPVDISDKLSDTDLPRIYVSEGGLAIDGVLLRTMGKYYGATNSVYDLRNVI